MIPLHSQTVLGGRRYYYSGGASNTGASSGKLNGPGWPGPVAEPFILSDVSEMAANRRIMESVAGISLVPTMCIDGILRGKLKINNGFGWSVLVSNRRGEEVYSVSLYHEDEDGKGALDCESVVAVALEAMMRNPDKRTVSEIVKAVRSLDHKGRIMYKENEWRWDK